MVGSRIHQGLVGARALVGTPYLADRELRQEYQRDIAPRTTAAMQKILAELYRPGATPRQPRRVVDLGAGTGAAGAAIAAYFSDPVELTAVDRLAGLPGVRDIDATDVSAVAATGAPFDLAVAAHLLNELRVGEADETRLPKLAALARRWCEELLSEGGLLILLEPALRETSRALLGIRDRLLADGLHVVAPCFFSGPCPALVRPRDWCHDSAGETLSRRVDFSYLVVRRPSSEPAPDPTLLRIVSDPLAEKGRLRLFGCGSDGRQALVRLNRHALPSNAAFGELSRGDVVEIRRTTFAQDGLRIGPDTAVARRR